MNPIANTRFALEGRTVNLLGRQFETTSARACLLNVLIVDDDGDSLEVLAELVKMLGHIPATAKSAEEALAYIEQAPPSICIADISLPDIDGCELIRRIRAGTVGGSMTLVALTGHSDAGTRAAAKRAGVDQFCLKPIDIEQLKGLLDGEAMRHLNHT